MIAVEVVGWIGALSLLAAYTLLTAGRVTPSGRAYTALNLVGSGGLAANGIAHTAWPSAALNLLWLAVAIRATHAGRPRRSHLAQAASERSLK